MNREKFNQIQNELRLIRLDLISKGENSNNALNIARSEINKKYGKGWREELLKNISSSSKSKFPTIYDDDHENGEHWMI